MAELTQSLEILQTLDLITLKKQDSDPEYAFKHIFTQESVYNSLLFSERREIHRQIGNTLEASIPQPTDDLILLLAHHFELGGVKDKALKYLTLAAGLAAKTFTNHEALKLYSEALALLDDNQYQERWDILYRREEILDRLGDRERQAGDLSLLQTIAELLNDNERQAMTHNRRAGYFDKTSEYQSAAEAAQRGMELAQKAGKPRLEAQSLNLLALAAWRRFDYTTVQKWASRALDILQIIGEPHERTTSLLHLGRASYRLGEYDIALNYIQAALKLTRQTDNKAGEATSNLILGWIYQRLGLYNKSAEHYKRKLNIHKAIGDRYGEATALSHLGWVAYDQAQYQQSESYCQQAIEISQQINDRENEAYALSGLGLAAEGMENWAAAQTFYEQALACHREINAQTLAMFDLSRLAKLALEANNLTLAYQYGQEVINWTAEHGAEQFWDPWLIYYANYLVLKANGKTEAAAATLKEAYTLLQTRANRISDSALRDSFLNNVKVNRLIAEAWQVSR